MTSNDYSIRHRKRSRREQHQSSAQVTSVSSNPSGSTNSGGGGTAAEHIQNHHLPVPMVMMMQGMVIPPPRLVPAHQERKQQQQQQSAMSSSPATTLEPRPIGPQETTRLVPQVTLEDSGLVSCPRSSESILDGLRPLLLLSTRQNDTLTIDMNGGQQHQTGHPVARRTNHNPQSREGTASMFIDSSMTNLPPNVANMPSGTADSTSFRRSSFAMHTLPSCTTSYGSGSRSSQNIISSTTVSNNVQVKEHHDDLSSMMMMMAGGGVEFNRSSSLQSSSNSNSRPVPSHNLPHQKILEKQILEQKLAAGKEDFIKKQPQQQPKNVSSSTSTSSSSSALRFRASHFEQWETRYQELIEFRRQEGHCLVPFEYAPNQTLSHWIKRQRGQWKLKQAGKRSTLTEERQTLLDELGFVWDSHKAAWEMKYHELRTFKEQMGHSNVPTTYPENPQLSMWLKTQRRLMKRYYTVKEEKDGNTTTNNNNEGQEDNGKDGDTTNDEGQQQQQQHDDDDEKNGDTTNNKERQQDDEKQQQNGDVVMEDNSHSSTTTKVKGGGEVEVEGGMKKKQKTLPMLSAERVAKLLDLGVTWKNSKSNLSR